MADFNERTLKKLLTEVLKEEVGSKLKVIEGRVSGIEDRAFGIERRISDLEDGLVEDRRKLLGLVKYSTGFEVKLIKLEDRLVKEFQDFVDKIQKFIDPVLKELQGYRGEQEINQEQHDKVHRRLDKLENIHPSGSHVSL